MPCRSSSARATQNSPLFKSGAEWAGVCYAAKDAVTFVAAFALMAAGERMDRRLIHAFCLTLGGDRVAEPLDLFMAKRRRIWLLLALGLGRDCLGFDSFDALRNSRRRFAAATNGRLHGHFQLLHRAAGNPCSANVWSGCEKLLGGNLVYAVMAGGGSCCWPPCWRNGCGRRNRKHRIPINRMGSLRAQHL